MITEREKEQSRIRNRRYYAKNKDRLNAEARERNWDFDAKKAKERRDRYNEAHPARNILKSRKSKALKNGIRFELTEEWYDGEWTKGCAVTGIQFDKSGSDTPWVAHIDRIKPVLGYTKENCRLVCACYNLAKKHWADADVLRMAQALLRTSDA